MPPPPPEGRSVLLLIFKDAPEDGEVRLDGHAAGSFRGTMRANLVPGEHRLEVQFPGNAPIVRRIELQERQELQCTVSYREQLIGCLSR